ncbi:MAG: putative signal transduction histidine kinase [Sphingobacteriales bacterium]|nr:putative signal transduction histidine kinase [Sphingobacteriales bacterium]
MKKKILFIALLSFQFIAYSQQKQVIDTVYQPTLVDHSPAGLGVLIGDNQSHLGKEEAEFILVSKPTIQESVIDKDGAFHIKAFVNNDYFNIVAKGINEDNIRYYTAYMANYFDSKPNDKVFDRLLQIPLYTGNAGYSFLNAGSINLDKTDGRNYLFVIKDNRTEKIIATMYLDFIFPKPMPYLISIDDGLLFVYSISQVSTYISPRNLIKFTQQIKDNNIVKTTFNSQTNLPDHLKLPSDKNSFIIQFKSLRLNALNSFQYSLDNRWFHNSTAKNYNPFIVLKNLDPGKHTLYVRYADDSKSPEFVYEFEIQPSLIQTTWFKAFLGGLFILIVTGLFLNFKFKKQKRILREESARKNELQNQISSLRAQLNPHFIFNALNSIQGLVNKNDLEGSNRYISKFGSLMRDILEQNNKTTHALALEVKQLESYLQLEQLRFRFSYQINIEDAINTAETDFPVMLLQPFAENAIKHGISGKKENGNISLHFTRNSNDMQVVIQDNGRGFNMNETSDGYGIKLIKERITVLNELYKEQPITCTIHAVIDQRTTVTLLFRDWL